MITIPSAPSSVDVVVVGAGAAGLAAAEALARRGRSVVAIDQFEPGHVRGSSHGSERIVRAMYTDDVHVDMAIASIEGWRDLENRTQTRLLTPTGGIDTGDASELDALEAQCARLGLVVERLDENTARRRFPSFRIDGDMLVHESTCTVHADRALNALRTSAIAHGAQLLDGAPVERVDVNPQGVRVAVGDASIDAATIVVTVGAWGNGPLTRDLLGDVAVPMLKVTREQVGFFAPRRGSGAFPAFVCREEPSVYGLPTPDGYVKVGEHYTGPIVDPDHRTFELEPATWGRLCSWVRRHLPGVDPEPVRSATCLYAGLADDMFILDRHGPAVFGLGLGGHGFKFVPEIGRRLADLAEGIDGPDNPFRFDRPMLPIGTSGHR